MRKMPTRLMMKTTTAQPINAPMLVWGLANNL